MPLPGLILDVLNWLLLTLGDAVQWLWNDGLGYVGQGLSSVNRVVNPILAPVFEWINVVVNAVAGWVLSPIGHMPGWLSNTIVSAITGVILLIIFKYTSNQKAIGRVKDSIKANMLALKLFKDELSVTLRSQKRVLLGAVRLLRYSLWPLLVMIVPVSLELGQLGVWYQWRPLRVGEETLVTVRLTGDPGASLPAVTVRSIGGAEVLMGPFRIPSKRETCWQIRADEPGEHRIVFETQGQTFDKTLVIGEGLARVSAVRPAADWTAIVVHPLEKPFAKNGPIHSVHIDYPSRESWTSGSDWWLAYFFVASLVFALIFKPFFKVRI